MALLLTATWASAKQPTTKKRLKVGLVLGGGGAKGAAHAGALKVIEESGVPIDFVAGTSIGSIVGGLYACGYRSDDIREMFRSQAWIDLLGDRNAEHRGKLLSKDSLGVVYVMGFPVRRRGSRMADAAPGAMRGDRIVALLDSMVAQSPAFRSGRLGSADDSIAFDRLPTPFRCVAVDRLSHTEYVFTSGRLATAMRASMAIPGAFKPVRRDSMELVDGGMLNNLPADVARAMGADVIIAVDLTQNKHDDEAERPEPHGKTALGRLISWAVSRPDLKKYRANRALCDVYINPDLEGYGAGSFRPQAIEDMIGRGERAAQQQRAALKKLRKRIAKGRR
ncbi:MAG: patatin-like phospholipase family protein [Prevotella sp.]|nr:patatin-like phospholipase family protein [Prevotella sp.]